jgi:short-subunit dehydrogenase
MSQPITLKDARVLLTGASSGIGRAIATSLAQEGAYVVATVRSEKDRFELHQIGCEVELLDVRSYEEHTRTIERMEFIDVLINNAGYSYRSSIEHGNENEIRSIFDVNFFAPCAIIRAVLPMMRQRMQGAIVNISSVSGRIGQPLNGYYSATKHALEAISEALAYEVRPFNIRVILIEPGRVKTSLHPNLHAEPSTYEDPLNPYAYLAEKLPPKISTGVEPIVVAQTVIKSLTTPPPNKLRWPATPDAEEIISNRNRMDDLTFGTYLLRRLGVEHW